jgi:hypothetical protein
MRSENDYAKIAEMPRAAAERGAVDNAGLMLQESQRPYRLVPIGFFLLQ